MCRLQIYNPIAMYVVDEADKLVNEEEKSLFESYYNLIMASNTCMHRLLAHYIASLTGPDYNEGSYVSMVFFQPLEPPICQCTYVLLYKPYPKKWQPRLKLRILVALARAT